MKNTVAAYLAGSIDADGSFTIRVDKTAFNRDGISAPQFNEMISMKQVTPQVPHLLYESFGGCLYLQPPSVTKGRPLWTWHVASAKASIAIRIILPFLLIKNEQAKILLELRERKDSYNRLGMRGKRMPVEEISAREELKARLKILNKVGV